MSELNNLIELAVAMTAIVEQETALLEQHNVPGILPLQDSKARAFQAYEAEIRALEADPARLAAASETTRSELKRVMADFQTVSQRNRRALKAARDGRRFLLNAIREAAVESTQQVSSYNRGGRTQTGVYGRTGGRAAAVALSESL